MSNRKTKKQKQLAEERIKARKAQIKELEELKTEAIELESRISEQRKENFRQFNIRNLKVFANACNFAAPFVITTGLTVGAFHLFGGGLPFYTDEITKYKVHNLDFQTNGYVTMEDEYTTDNLLFNNLVVYTPWEEQDGKYIRFKRKYNIEKTTLDLYDAVLDEDYDYISDNLKDYKEEKQTTNEIDKEEANDYFFEASLQMLDEEDTLKYNETDLKNIVITIIELVLGLGFGGAIAYFRDFEFSTELRRINTSYSYLYNYKVTSLKSMKQEFVKLRDNFSFNKKGSFY